MRLFLCLLMMFMVFGAPSSAQERESAEQTVRLFGYSGTQKIYYTGYDWMNFDIIQKIKLVERARNGALKINAVLTLPAEIYIAELDRMFTLTPSARHIEIGQAIKGVAISLKDWDDGTDPSEKLNEYLPSSDNKG